MREREKRGGIERRKRLPSEKLSLSLSLSLRVAVVKEAGNEMKVK